MSLNSAETGVVLFFTGAVVLKNESLSGVGIGLGAALFCLGVGNAAGALLISKSENNAMKRRKENEIMDERNIRIREKVGAKINQVVLYMVSLIVLALGFMGAV